MNFVLRVALFVIGVSVFYGICSWIAATTDVSDPPWYSEPVVFPVRVGLWFGKGGYEGMNAIAGNIAWYSECAIAGGVCVFAGTLLARRIQRRHSITGKNA
jgi:hypothetical protein